MKLSAVWGVAEDETDGDRVDLDSLDGLRPADLADLERDLELGPLTVAPGSVGKGASGPGAALIIEVAERVLNDTASLLALGAGLHALIQRVTARRKKPPAILDANALGSLAAHYARDVAGHMRYVKTVALNVQEEIGTDELDVWAACFDDSDAGAVLVVFLSPTGMWLGQVRVPTELYVEDERLHRRSAEEIATWWYKAKA